MNIIIKIFYVLTVIGVFAGAVMFLITLTQSTGAPQEAAGAAMSLCFAIIPYCLARAVEKLLGDLGKKKLDGPLPIYNTPQTTT
jgi:hypothetical protein